MNWDLNQIVLSPLTAQRLARFASAIALTATLVGCGGGGSESSQPGTTTYTVEVTVTGAASGETFTFAVGTQSVSATAAAPTGVFPTALASGSSYTVSQTAGPRTCTLSANRSGTITANVSVGAACPVVAGGTTPKGQFFAPIGSRIVLQNNGGDDLMLTLTASAGNVDAYDVNSFAFATPQADGTTYQATLKTVPVNQTCRVFRNANGTLPVPVDTISVGCEYTYDFVSRSTNNAVLGSSYESETPVLGGANVAVGSTTQGFGEGRFVAFMSGAAGLGGASGSRRQIFWRDRGTGETRLVSANAAGAEGNEDCFAPAISADGLWVVFESYASNLVSGDTNGVRDIFVWSAVSPNGVQRISVGAGGVQANSESFEPVISGDGKVVAFSSGASNLTSGVSGIGAINVYRRDMTTGTNKLVTTNPSGQAVGGSNPALSEDGNRLAFYSFASDIVSGDSNGLWDIFVYAHSNGAKARVSVTSTGGERDQGFESSSRIVAPAISGNGRYVAYATTATNVVPGDTNDLQDVFVVDLDTETVVRASVASNGAQGNADSPNGQGERVALSYDGRWVAFTTTATNLGATPGTTGVGNMLMHNIVSGETRTVTNQTSGSVSPPSMSRSGAYVSFGAANELDPRFGSSGLFVRYTGMTGAWFWVP